MKKSIDLNKLLFRPTTPYERFHSKTKSRKKDVLLPVKQWPKEWKKIYYKSYPRLPEVVLPLPEKKKKMQLQDAITKRFSQRKFDKKPISEEQLSNLLYFSAGIKSNANLTQPHRMYPSAGARYPLEVYLILQHTTFPPGIYHYYVKSHTLEKLAPLDKKVIEKAFYDEWVYTAPCIILITSMFTRTTVKYSNRGYRFALLEAGHLAQNFSLNALANTLYSTPIGSYHDDSVNSLLDIDGTNETVIHSLVIGSSTHIDR